MRVFAFILFLSPSFVWAAPPSLALRSSAPQDDCVIQFFMSSASFTSSTLSESMLAHLPPNAQAYLRFLWAGYENKFIDVTQLTKIAMSTAPVNPFREAAEKALEARLHMAIADKIADMTAQDWLAITNELQQHLPDLEKETVERNDATDASSTLIGLSDPQVTNMGSVHLEAASWFEYQGRVLLAVNCSERAFCIYELDLTTGKPLMLVKETKAGRYYKTPSMYAHDGHLYLAAGTYGNGKEMCVFELDLLARELKELDFARADDKRSFNTPAWYEHAGRLYLVAGTRPTGFYFYKFRAGKLSKGQLYQTWGLHSEPFVWQVYKGDAYLALHTDRYNVHAYKLNSLGELIFCGSAPSRAGVPQWLIRNDRLYLAAGFGDRNLTLYVLDIQKGGLHKLEPTPLDISDDIEGPAWFEYKGRQLVAVPDMDGIHVFELVVDEHNEYELIKRGSFRTPGLIRERLLWVEFGGRLFLAVSSVDSELYLLEFNLNTSRLVKRSSWPAVNVIRQPLAFYKRDDHLYLEAIDEDGHLYHFSLVQKVVGRGR